MSGKQKKTSDTGEIEAEQEVQEANTEQEQTDSTTIESIDDDIGEENGPTIESLTEEIEVLKQLAEESLEKAVLAQADMDNLRKRTVRDIENAHKYALERFVNELLPVLDSMELGISASDNAENTNDLREGMELTLKILITAMEKFDVKVIDPQGEKFNPEQHEAISMQEFDGAESGTVANVVQKGYELNGRLVRPAMVIVAK
jgi:molecular chaperone GrpE